MSNDAFKKFMQTHVTRFADDNGCPDYHEEDMQAAFAAGQSAERNELKATKHLQTQYNIGKLEAR